MLQQPTLDELATNAGVVYLDSCIFYLDKNPCDGEQDKVKLFDRLKAIKWLSQREDILMKRHEAYISKLLPIINKYPNIVSPPRVLNEYRHFCKAVRSSFLYFKRGGNSTKQRLAALEDLMSIHKQAYEALGVRKEERPVAEELMFRLLDRGFHIPKGQRFRKKKEATESHADVELVSYAISKSFDEEKPVAIVSSDFDIPVIMQNIVPLCIDIFETPVLVYFPDYRNWLPDFRLNFMVNNFGGVNHGYKKNVLYKK